MVDAHDSVTVLQNAFSERIGTIDPTFNFFQLLVNDFLHEFELSDWKSFFTHVIRIIHGLPATAVKTFDER